MKKLKSTWIIIYTFLAIFQPPILPVSLIYVLGAFTIIVMLKRTKGKIPLTIYKQSGIIKIHQFFLLMLLYFVTVSLINELFYNDVYLVNNRLSVINQLIVLSTIQFVSIWYIISMCEDLNYNLHDLFQIIIYAGIIQGFCSVLAYFVPTIRSIFIYFGDSNLYSNAYILERRGYGFSSTLLDTFGYGMGLIAGYSLLILKNNFWRKMLSIILIIISIILNSRTGIIIFGIAAILFLFKGRNVTLTIVKTILTMPLIYIVLKFGVPKLLDSGVNSSNITIQWVTRGIMEFYNLLFNNSGSETLKTASFLDNFDNLPTEIFSLIFGSGHSIYDTRSLLGFRTDVGYINIIWIYGILGLIVFSFVFIKMFIKAFKLSLNFDYRFIVIFNMLSYFIVEFKANLIGYNPGVFVTYLTTFAIIYFGNKDRQLNSSMDFKKGSNTVQKRVIGR